MNNNFKKYFNQKQHQVALNDEDDSEFISPFSVAYYNRNDDDDWLSGAEEEVEYNLKPQHRLFYQSRQSPRFWWSAAGKWDNNGLVQQQRADQHYPLIAVKIVLSKFNLKTSDDRPFSG